MESIQLIWSDKKRYFGMPISFTRYSLSEERLFSESGVLVNRHEQTMLYRVQDIKVRISLWQRFFGVGTVTVISNDKSMPDLELKNIQDPLYVKEVIHRLVEAIRTKKNITASEFMR
jgi:uncharacterized membrane protein YdbT with pleckstrin-like domain